MPRLIPALIMSRPTYHSSTSRERYISTSFQHMFLAQRIVDPAVLPLDRMLRYEYERNHD